MQPGHCNFFIFPIFTKYFWCYFFLHCNFTWVDGKCAWEKFLRDLCWFNLSLQKLAILTGVYRLSLYPLYIKAIWHRWITQAVKMEFIVININALPALGNSQICLDPSISVSRAASIHNIWFNSNWQININKLWIPGGILLFNSCFQLVHYSCLWSQSSPHVFVLPITLDLTQSKGRHELLIYCKCADKLDSFSYVWGPLYKM